MKMLCSIYRSSRKEGLYLYVRRGHDLEELPVELWQGFGRAEHAMDLLLESGRSLARADVQNVMKAIDAQQFYLQMPPEDLPAQ